MLTHAQHAATLRQLREAREAVLVEAFGRSTAMRSARLNREANIIMGCTMLGAHSSNGVNRKRKYGRKAMEQVVALGEGLPAYANHVAPELAFKPRDVRDLIGRHVNVKYDPATNRVTSDLHLLEHQAPWVFSLAERLGDSIGNSLVSRGMVRMEGEVEVVDEIVALRSCDLVSDPAATRGLFEGQADVRRLAEACAACDAEGALGGWTADDGSARRRWRHPRHGTLALIGEGWQHHGPDGRVLKRGTGPEALRAYAATLGEAADDLHAHVVKLLVGEPVPAGLHERLCAALGLPTSAPRPETPGADDLHARLAAAVTR